MPSPRLSAAAVVLAMISLGCRTQAPTSTTRASITPSPVTRSDLTPYPIRIADFLRTDPFPRSRDPHDIAVGYNFFRGLAFTEVAFTAYFYTNPEPDDSADSLARHFASIDDTIRRKHPDSKTLLTDTTTHTLAGKTIPGLLRTYTYTQVFGAPDRTAVVLSEYRLFLLGRTAILYRITYPESHPADTLARLREFQDNFTWPASITPDDKPAARPEDQTTR